MSYSMADQFFQKFHSLHLYVNTENYFFLLLQAGKQTFPLQDRVGKNSRLYCYETTLNWIDPELKID